MSAHNKPSQIPNATTVTGTTFGKMLFWGDGEPPATGVVGYATGAIYVRTDGAAFFQRMYINKGDETDAAFVYINAGG